MGCRVGYSGVGVRVEVCPPCKDPHPRLGYPGYSGYWTVHAMPVHAQIGSAYSESLTFNPPTCPGSPVSLCHHLVLTPLVVPVFHPHRQQIETFSQAVKGMLLIRHQFSWLKTHRLPTSHWLMSKLKNTVIPHCIHLTLPPDDCSSVWTSQEFWKDVGCIWDRLVFFRTFSVLF